ncbi:MAG: hypothetical protein U5J96_19790 [Ignavibacteriaceae bacterium]|nr:hypothetical protein [Ignavibacteriaceae bacterium]
MEALNILDELKLFDFGSAGAFRNYPNPFNPKHNDTILVTKQTHLKINLFNMLGEQVATIAEGMYESGYY